MGRTLRAWMQMDELAYRPKSRASYDANGAVLNGVYVVNGGVCNDAGTWIQNDARLQDATLKGAVHAAGQLYMPMVAVADGTNFGTVLDNPTARAAAIDNLLELALERELDGPWDGVDFDLEGIGDEYRDALTAWFEDAISALHAEGLLANITFCPHCAGGCGTVYDVAALSGMADSMTPMLYAYDSFEGATSMRTSLDTVMAEGLDNHITLAGICVTSCYKDAVGTWYHVSHAYAQDVLTAAGQHVHWLETSGADRTAFQYAAWDTQIMRMRDEISLRIRLNWVDEYNLAGAALFVLGSENAEVWPVVAEWQAGATHWHGYAAIERVGLGAAGFTTFLNYAKVQGQKYNKYPHRLNHWRTISADACLVEAEWGNGELSADHCADWLGAIIDVDVGDITQTASSVTYVSRASPVTLFSNGGTDYVRLRILGGLNATWEQSRIEALGYLAT